MVHLKNTEPSIIYLSLNERVKDFGTPTEYILHFRNLQDTEVLTPSISVLAENERVTKIEVDSTILNPAEYEYLALGVINGENVLFERGLAKVEGNEYFDTPVIEPQINVNYE
jgi:hypothetical protein